MLDPAAAERLRGRKNLLAFSGGADSTALFHLLLDAGIGFDVAHVNYRTRPQSDAEASGAAELAKRHGKRFFLREAEPIEKNFEAQARRVRYAFFDEIAQTFGYETVLTAHQLDDRLEWLLMRLCKGAGLPEMLGMKTLEEREHYTLVRPLLGRTKAELKSWLLDRGHPWFEDESNGDERFGRNRIRRRFAAPLLEEWREGIGASFRFLERDAAALGGIGATEDFGELLYLETTGDRLQLMRAVDRWLKTRGYLMRKGDRERILHENEVVIGRRYALSVGDTFALLAPVEKTTAPKPFRERCRRLGIGPAVRPFLYRNPDLFNALLRRLAPGNGG